MGRTFHLCGSFEGATERLGDVRTPTRKNHRRTPWTRHPTAWAVVIGLLAPGPGGLGHDVASAQTLGRMPNTWTPSQQARAEAAAETIRWAKSNSKRLAAIKELHTLGAAARFGVRDVWYAWKLNPAPKIKQAAFQFLTDRSIFGVAHFPAMVFLTEDPDPDLSKLANQVRFLPDVIDLSMYVTALRDPWERVRAASLMALNLMGAPAHEAIPAISELALERAQAMEPEDNPWDDQILLLAGDALAGIGLDYALKDLLSEPLIQEHMKSGKGGAFSLLLSNLADLYCYQVEEGDLEAIEKLGEGLGYEIHADLNSLAAWGSECLVAALEGEVGYIRDAAANVLIESGKRGDYIYDDLLPALGEPSEPRPAAIVLKRIGSAAVTPEFLALLDDLDSSTRIRALLALEFLGSDAASVGPMVATMAAEDVDPKVREAATRVLQRIGASEVAEIELGPGGTTVNSYALGPEATARWMKMTPKGQWSAGVTFGKMPSNVSLTDVRIGLYDVDHRQIDAYDGSTSGFEGEAGTHYLRIYLESGNMGSETVPVLIDILED